MFTSVNSEKEKIEKSIELDSITSLTKGKFTHPSQRNSIFSNLSILFEVNDDYLKLQIAILCLTFAFSLIISATTSLLISSKFGLSIFIGSIAGIFYLRLLAKSIGNLGKNSPGVSKVQILLPVCLFIFASKNEFIDILPAIIGFFLYKPSLIYYFSRS